MLYFNKESEKLETAEQNELLKKYHSNITDEEKLEIKEKLICSNMGFINYFVTNFIKNVSIKTLEPNDYYMEAICGLIEAIDKFDYSKNIPLIGYAQFLMQKRLGILVNNNIRLLKFPEKYFYELRDIKNSIEGDVSRKDISSQLGISMKKIEAMLDSESFKFVNINDKFQDSDTCLADVIEDKNAKMDDKGEVHRILCSLVEQLTPKEKAVVNRFYGLKDSGGEYNAKIGKDLGLSRERIRQINKRACEKLKAKLGLYNISKDVALGM
jgi:RNA polymerase primary sigma factor